MTGTALVSLSHVAYRSAALADMATITDLVHAVRRGHAVGPVSLGRPVPGAARRVRVRSRRRVHRKDINAGPGAPAFLNVRRDLQDLLREPIWGRMGERNLFEMGSDYDLVPGIERFTAGTPAGGRIEAAREGARLRPRPGSGRAAG